MGRVGQEIVDRQNQPEHINKLCAQRQVYSKAKSIFYLRVLAVVVIPVVISIIVLIFNKYREKLDVIFALYALMAMFGGFFLENYVKELKKIAATIQESFDTSVLRLPWNSVLLSNRPDPETIYSYSAIYKRKNETRDLYGWYPEIIQTINSNIAVLICQRANCSYDFSIRKAYGNFLRALLLGTFFLLLIPSYYMGLTIQTFVTNVLLPLIPLFYLTFEQISQNKESVTNLKELKNLIESNICQIDINNTVDTSLLREVQNKIFMNRSSSPLLSNKFFRYLRPAQEEQMYFGAEETIRSLKV